MPKDILMPALSPTMQAGNLAKWLVIEGQDIRSGDLIAEIETDKSVMELESTYDGKIAKLLIPAGTRDVAVNSVIAVLLEEGESLEKIGSAQRSIQPTPAIEQPMTDAKELSTGMPTPTKPHQIVNADRDMLRASPVAKKMAQEMQIDLRTVRGTGPDNRVIKADVIASKISSPVAQGEHGHTQSLFAKSDEIIQTSNMRRIIASRLLESKSTIPHFYLEIGCEIDALTKLRETLNRMDAPETKLTVNDFIVKAVALAIRQNPAINASWQKDDTIVRYGNINVCVAVAVADGLVTPVVRNTDSKTLQTISTEVKAIAAKARSGKIMPEDLTGGTFTISNLGMYGIPRFSAIINPPQAAILAIGAGIQQAVVKNGAATIATIMTVVLSVDHRVIDGALGAQFLTSFKGYIENPLEILLK